MDFKDYIIGAEKTFSFRIKTLFPLDDAAMDLLEKALQKYRPTSISKPTKMMYQTNPLGFTGVAAAEVYMFDTILTVPVTATLLQFDLRAILGLNKDDGTIKAFSAQTDELEVTAEPQEKAKVALLTNEHYEEIEEADFNDYYGADYNKKFLEYVKKVDAERAAKARRGNLDPAHPITKWSDQPKGTPSVGDTEQK